MSLCAAAESSINTANFSWLYINACWQTSFLSLSKGVSFPPTREYYKLRTVPYPVHARLCILEPVGSKMNFRPRGAWSLGCPWSMKPKLPPLKLQSSRVQAYRKASGSKLSFCGHRCHRNLNKYRHVAWEGETSSSARRKPWSPELSRLWHLWVEGLEIMFVIYVLPEPQMTPT